MRTIETTFNTFGASVLLIGLKGDSNATEILIDCAESLEEYQGTMAAMSITGPDETVYPGDISLDENGIVHWVVAARDCGIAGHGSARVDLVDDLGTVVASAEARTIIMKTNMQGIAPDQIANWTEAASVALQEVRAALLDLIDNDETAIANEAARQLAETGRVSAETLRASAETSRASAETARATAETARASAETARATAETARASAETARATAETARVSEFSTMQANAQAALSYIGPSEASSTASADHAAGSYFTYNGKLYQATDDIAIGDNITSGTNCAQVPGGAMGEVSNLKSAINDITDTETIGGKNIFNPVYILDAENWDENDGEYYGPLNKLASEYSSTGYPFSTSFKESTQYTLSLKHKCGTDSAVMAVKFYYTDGTNTTVAISRSADWATGTATSAANKTLSYMYISYSSKGTAIWYLKEIQFEEGASATAYEEYGAVETVHTIKSDAIPDGSISEEKLDFSPSKGQFVSRFAGKKVSIIGDSIDTFDADGYKISGYRMYYPALGVTNVNDTWWKRVLDASGAVIEVNASWSGSCVTDYASESGYPDFYDRVSLIGTPDIVFVTLGTNDSRHSVSLGDYDFETTYTSLSESTFRTAYIKGIKAIKATYPDAEIICMAQQMDDDYRDSIAYIAKNLQCEFLDTSDYIGQDTVHPGVYGMRQLSALVLYATDTELSQKHLPADGKVTGQRLNTVEDAVNGVASAIRTAYITGTNIFDSKHLLTAGWENTGDVYSGTLTNLISKYGANGEKYPFRNAFKPNTQYTFSCKGYTLNEKSGSGLGLIVKYIYTDGTSGQSGIDNTSNTFTDFTFTSAANKTISEIRFSYGSKPANVWYLKEIQLEEGTSAGTYEAYSETAIPVIKPSAIEDGSITKAKLAFDIDDSVIMNADSFPQCVFSFEQAESDMTFANGKLLAFGSSSDDHTSYAGIAVYTIDYANKTATKDKTLLHNWGHVNSIDFSSGADAFITSNAGQSTTDEGIIYIIENASDILALSNNTQIPLATYVKQIDCSGLNFGHKFQLVWGESNGGRYDIVYLLSSDMANIRKLQLGKGSNEFEYGTLISGAESNEFNGTFRVISTFTNNLPQQNNGTAYRDGAIWACGTHSGKNIEKMIPQVDGSVYVEKYKEILYGADGTALTTYGEGIAFDGNHMAYGTGLVIGIYDF